MIKFSVDQRGNLKAHIDAFFSNHPRIGNNFTVEIKNNQSQDFLCESPSVMAEFKEKQDAHDYKRLEREIQEVYAAAHKDYCYLFLVNVDMKDLMVIMSMVDKFFPLIRVKIYATMEGAIAGLLKILESPPSYMNSLQAPVDYRDEAKGLICSLAYLVDGITPDLARYIWEFPTTGNPWFRSWRDFFIVDMKSTDYPDIYMTPGNLCDKFEAIFYQYYTVTNADGSTKNIHHDALAKKLAEKIFSIYHPK